MEIYTISSKILYISSDNSNFEDLIFSIKCVTEEVPGINKMLGDRLSNQAKAICFVVAVQYNYF